MRISANRLKNLASYLTDMLHAVACALDEIQEILVEAVGEDDEEEDVTKPQDTGKPS